jgi:hypothetical protein
MNIAPEKIPRTAAALGYGGVVPFAALALVFAFGPDAAAPGSLDGFLIYGAVILSFLGGIRWGAASGVAHEHARGLVVSIIPSLWAAVALWWPDPAVTAWALLVGFVLMAVADWWRPGVGVPAWMRPLRVRLSAAVVLCHALVVATL